MAVEFHTVPVTVKPLTVDAVGITLDLPHELREEFRHRPGQHLVLRAMIDGEDVRRSYSICTSANDDSISVGIKRIPDGVFSTYATQQLASGDTIDVMTPIGEFGHSPDPVTHASYVALAAGSGITPVLSILTTTLEVEPASRCTLIYGNRTSSSIMFLEEIEALKNRFPDRFQVVHILSREPHEIPLFEGRIDAAKIQALASSLIDANSVAAWFLCGPLDMVETAQHTLADLGVPSHRVHAELFFDERIETIPEPDATAEGMVTLELTIDGRTSVVDVDPEGPAILDYARSVRSEVPFACKGGMCATCKAKVIEGNVRLEKNYALTAEEVDAGFVLTCQAHPVDGDVTITYDVHGGVGR
ncbi:MAG: phenylacetate-CoA oxygenase/reductase subunit PaaK [Acidimicrobiales bacterium]|nr:MAG: phenylacetate-CoA oxygenase/reductase subunit PaaK [Acidimicrobiales bacterium]